TLCIQIVQTGTRMACVGRLYGAVFAIAVPLRSICANWINSVATFSALYRYFKARMRHEPLVWIKTEHAYPSRSALVEHKRKLGEILVGSDYISDSTLDLALKTLPQGMRLGEYLVSRGDLREDDLYEALSLQQSLPAGRLEPWVISSSVARSLPLQVIRSWKVLPFRIASGNMYLASPEIPTDELSQTLR